MRTIFMKASIFALSLASAAPSYATKPGPTTPTPTVLGLMGSFANSTSGAAVDNCNCVGKHSAKVVSGNTSLGTASINGTVHKSFTNSESYGSGKSYNGNFLGVATGVATGYTFGAFGTH